MLKQINQTLPASLYFDPEQYQRELAAIWWKEWLCIARSSEWSAPGMYQVFSVGGQEIIITLTEKSGLRAFHNTCRHRGSILCERHSGAFSQGRIVCPYHAWAYSLEGDLTHTPHRVESADFTWEDKSLYRVALETWRGFVFINLAENPAPLNHSFDNDVDGLANWPLDELALAHREVHKIACNWKIFWENFLECYHCPSNHAELCKLVPFYRQGLLSAKEARAAGLDLELSGSNNLVADAVTWSHGGETPLPWFKELTDNQQAAGMTFTNVLPGMFIVAHVDYVRSVHVMPLGPESTQLTVNWMLLPETLAEGTVDIGSLTAFARQLVKEDVRLCELNQRGLHSIRHERGLLVPQEYDVLAFDNWVLDRLNNH